jgi:NAD(P)-dependent dehydrogenase (short-subunit alcohol dehydrogenase family)
MKLLDGKVAVIYGAAGVIGSAVAKAFAKEGANVILTGRTLSTLESLAGKISEAGGFAEVARVDALDSKSVGDHLQKLVASKGKLDISFNLISTSVGMGSRLTELSEEKFVTAAFSRVRSYFVTSTSAARIMQKQGKGVILGLTARMLGCLGRMWEGSRLEGLQSRRSAGSWLSKWALLESESSVFGPAARLTVRFSKKCSLSSPKLEELPRGRSRNQKLNSPR